VLWSAFVRFFVRLSVRLCVCAVFSTTAGVPHDSRPGRDVRHGDDNATGDVTMLRRELDEFDLQAEREARAIGEFNREFRPERPVNKSVMRRKGALRGRQGAQARNGLHNFEAMEKRIASKIG